MAKYLGEIIFNVMKNYFFAIRTLYERDKVHGAELYERKEINYKWNLYIIYISIYYTFKLEFINNTFINNI